MLEATRSSPLLTDGLCRLRVVVEVEASVLEDTIASLPLVPPRPKLVQVPKTVGGSYAAGGLLDSPRGCFEEFVSLEDSEYMSRESDHNDRHLSDELCMLDSVNRVIWRIIANCIRRQSCLDTYYGIWKQLERNY